MSIHLFIGGPWDGQCENIDSHHNEWNVRDPASLVPIEAEVTEAELGSSSITRYTIRHWVAGEGSFFVFAEEGLDDYHTMLKLLKFYATGKR